MTFEKLLLKYNFDVEFIGCKYLKFIIDNHQRGDLLKDVLQKTTQEYNISIAALREAINRCKRNSFFDQVTIKKMVNRLILELETGMDDIE